MFLAPALYALHAVLTGLSMVIMHALGVHLGFSFSAGLFDYVLNYSLATRPLWLLPIGAGYFALYYFLFRYGITRFNLATPGREAVEASGPEGLAGPAATRTVPGGRAAGIVAALGGKANLTSVDACTPRLRLTVVDGARVDAAALARLGAMGVVRPAPTAVQVVMGPIADQVADEIRTHLHATAAGATVAIGPLLEALGGTANLVAAELVADRVLLRVARPELVDRNSLDALIVRGATVSPAGVVHLLLGPQAPAVADSLRAVGIALEIGGAAAPRSGKPP
jgi:PTS system N-acetylglucosamine-specific IIC component